jgi:hypothetical protein
MSLHDPLCNLSQWTEPTSVLKSNRTGETSNSLSSAGRDAIPPAYTQGVTVGAGVEEYNGPGK